MRVWDVTWGRASADLVIEGGYVDITNSRIGDRGRCVRSSPNGRYALGFRRDDEEEIKAHVAHRPIGRSPICGTRFCSTTGRWTARSGAADLDLSGKYREMFGSGTLRIDRGVAWDEPFESATGVVELEGTGHARSIASR